METALKIQVSYQNKKEIIEVDEKLTLLENLRKYDYILKSPCGMRGTCNQCMIGIRVGMNQIRMKACQVYPKENMSSVIYETSLEEIIFVPMEVEMTLSQKPSKVVIDLGTTTVILGVFDLDKEEITYLTSDNNPQRIWGADVLSRISVASDPKIFEQISQKIQDKILKMLTSLEVDKKADIIVSGNTTMIHFLCHFPVDKLGVYPFLPYELDPKPINLGDYQLHLMPGLSAFVGGDIVSGILACDLLRQDRSLLLDIGTNAEMVFSFGRKLYIASAAAGPAFEGVGIHFGMAAVAGAIKEVSYKNGTFSYQTIGGKEAKGICGSGLISLLAACIREGLVESSGVIKDNSGKLYLTPEIYIDNEDISLLLLAKAAILTGIEILTKDFGKIDKLYLSGGFSSSLKVEDAMIIGLIPKLDVDKVRVVANTSLLGGAKYLQDLEKTKEEIEVIKKSTHFVSLAEHKDFQDIYIQNIGVNYD